MKKAVESVWYNEKEKVLGHLTLHYNDGTVIVMRIWRSETEFNPISFLVKGATYQWFHRKMRQHGWVSVGEI